MSKINTVQELIDHLKTFDPNTTLNVQVPCYEGPEDFVGFSLSTENVLMQCGELYVGVSSNFEDDELVEDEDEEIFDEDDCAW